MANVKDLILPQVRVEFQTAREGNHLYNKSYWHHNDFDQVVQIIDLSYDGDLNEVIVQFRYQTSRLDGILFSQRKSAFLKSYHQVQSVQRWEPVRDRTDR